MSNELQLVQNQALNRLEDSLFAPDKCEHYERLASKLATSSVIPKNYMGKPTDLFVAMAMGYQLGMPVEQAIQDIAVINGRPCMWGDGLLAVVMGHGDFDDIIEEPMMNGQTVVGYSCTVKRRGKADYTKVFTLDMAKKAGLLGKPGPWTQYPDRMLQMRARGFALRDRFPDALRGIKSREEVEDIIEIDESGEVVASKSSRTEQLKKDIKKRFGEVYEQSTEEIVEDSEDNAPNPSGRSEPIANAANASNQNEQQNSNDALTKGKKVKSEQVDDSPITDDQIDLISSLLKESNDPERRDKAFRYFEITELTELNVTQAKKFIELLNKSAPSN